MLNLVEAFEINQKNDIATLTNTTNAVMSLLGSWRQAEGRQLIIRPGDIMSAYLLTNAGPEASDASQFKLCKRDSQYEDEIIIEGIGQYGSLKDFKNSDKIYRMTCQGKSWEINENEYLLLYINAPTSYVLGATATISIQAHQKR